MKSRSVFFSLLSCLSLVFSLNGAVHSEDAAAPVPVLAPAPAKTEAAAPAAKVKKAKKVKAKKAKKEKKAKGKKATEAAAPAEKTKEPAAPAAPNEKAKVVAAPKAEIMTVNFKQGAGAKIWINGDSTLHKYKLTSESPKINVKMTFKEGQKPWASQMDTAQVTSANVVLSTKSLKSEKDDLSKNAHEALKAGEFPEIAFALTKPGLVAGKGSPYSLKVVGELTIAGVKKSIDFAANAEMVGEKLTITVDKIALKMSDFGVKAPEMFFGTVKTKDDIEIGFTIPLEESGK